MVIQRVRVTPGGFDADGDPISGTTTATELPGAFIAPRDASEILDRARQGVIVGLTLYAPADTDLLYTDQVTVDGSLYNIDGDVAPWVHPMTGWAPGLVAALTRANG